ncbi:hypothetical protein JG687_00011593, partial [Phytophthora cactorum]
KNKPARAAVLAAVAKREFPPALKYPEKKGDLLSSRFDILAVSWVPECMARNRNQRIMWKCLCEPDIQKYMSRYVENVEHKTVLYYGRYKCARTSKRTFRTLDDNCISSSKKMV